MKAKLKSLLNEIHKHLNLKTESKFMKKIFLVLAVAGYMSACAPTSQTTSSTGTTTDGTTTDGSTSDSNTSDSSTTGTSGTDTNNSSTSDSNASTTDTTSTSSSDMNSSSTTDSDMESADSTSTQSSSSTDMSTSSSTSETDVMGSSTTITMDQLPKAVRDAYMKMPGHENASGEKVYQVKTSEHPVLYKIEGTSGSTDYVHYFTPEGNEVQMDNKK